MHQRRKADRAHRSRLTVDPALPSRRRASRNEFLPRAVEVNTGFMYGFEKVPNSGQIDVLIWDSTNHAAVYRTDSFVIVPPEAAIVAVSVKTNMQTSDVIDAIANLLTIAPLDLAYRGGLKEPLPPVSKYAVCFDGNPKPQDLAVAVAAYLRKQFATEQQLADAVVPALAKLTPIDPEREHRWQVDRVLPEMIISLDESNGCAFTRGWGPGIQVLNARYGIRRSPWLYPLGERLTSFFEKFLYHLLSDVYAYLQTRGRSLTAAWGDFHPQWGFRIGDAEEIQEHAGGALLDPETVLAPKS
jgi:hypothetical protein